jgi:hypothetical protein
MRRLAATGAIVLGFLLLVGGATTYLVVSNTLGEQNITTADDACLPGNDVNGPFTAYCQAKVIDHHALDATGGQRYAEMDREDPLRATAMNASFLQASLFTSVLAFGVAAQAMGMGVIFILLGLGIRDVAETVKPTSS